MVQRRRWSLSFFLFIYISISTLKPQIALSGFCHAYSGYWSLPRTKLKLNSSAPWGAAKEPHGCEKVPQDQSALRGVGCQVMLSLL